MYDNSNKIDEMEFFSKYYQNSILPEIKNKLMPNNIQANS